jgi:hypothetical protein
MGAPGQPVTRVARRMRALITSSWKVKKTTCTAENHTRRGEVGGTLRGGFAVCTVHVAALDHARTAYGVRTKRAP